ncbi:50S ribosomal protein L6 [Schleiferilactobacillus harbinensis]|uniref:Large ribosomal subunit protein uL6 n=2 Tax=Schleiferilactobacillus harbinensis TaxID=304207 RepID=A0A510TWP0_9LACO|nr:50S ribosomal protein L6 [Schleiferilactobacillus harbinensis]KRM24632.1 50S ribosomal protein L6 [Schleiferilactobacillus harbinensis DSM 16991]MBO3090573.1 50S ribosomal protein L6 [Schleiferilactobacillus harbinensis]MCI1687458.1 50S ribosomal protein L6 [Schleiferilactobacillus harbinensis]MCI1783964.1 50S ribosomal protein L6 [Schleiferilactobacillus harbinensis]MCI1850465.1 50S ribosomal protein L6 [Schleiferilactobacillus harbinensis]
MSRIGYKAITVPAGVTVTVNGDQLTVKGPKGEMTRQFDPAISINQEDNEIHLDRPNDSLKAIHGTTRANLNNMVVGVTEGYTKKLQLVGVGYRAQLKGDTLILNVGYSHPVEMHAPKGVKIEVPSNTEINLSGISKQVIGAFAATIREVRPPEPYKGKGIRYVDEYVRRKEGKTGK